MIGSLRGVLVERALGSEALVEVAGVGYRVTVNAGTAARLGGQGAPAFLWIHHHIRDDQQVLYGFGGRAERDCFEALIGAHGVGPALAMAILSVHSPLELARILADDDLAALCLVPGVGRKTAARLVIELKSRLLDDDGRPLLGDSEPAIGTLGLLASSAPANGAANGAATDGAATNGAATNGAGSNGAGPTSDGAEGEGGGASHSGGPGSSASAGDSPRRVVRQALAELGYAAEETRRALAALDQDDALVGADERVLLRAALRQMGR